MIGVTTVIACGLIWTSGDPVTAVLVGATSVLLHICGVGARIAQLGDASRGSRVLLVW